jgi:hypothetical protein
MAHSNTHRHTDQLGSAGEANPGYTELMRGKVACHSVGNSQCADRGTCRNQPASGCDQCSLKLLQSGLVQRDSKQGLRRVLVALVRGVLLLGGDWHGSVFEGALREFKAPNLRGEQVSMPSRLTPGVDASRACQPRAPIPARPEGASPHQSRGPRIAPVPADRLTKYRPS